MTRSVTWTSPTSCNHSARSVEQTLLVVGSYVRTQTAYERYLPISMAEKDKNLKCTQDGNIGIFRDYIRRVHFMRERTRRRRRRDFAPDLVAQQTGEAWVITPEIDHTKLTQKDGADYLIGFVGDRLATSPGRSDVPSLSMVARDGAGTVPFSPSRCAS